MTEIPNSDELLEAHKEIRHLKETVVALRAEMEQLRGERDEASHKAVAESKTELRQLPETIGALREGLESEWAQAAEDRAESEQDLRGDIDHLQNMITVLREQVGAERSTVFWTNGTRSGSATVASP